MKAIQDKDILHITYKSYNQEKEEAFIFHPYFLKHYNKRWFLFGQREEFDIWTNLALDRIVDFTKSYKHGFKSNNEDPEEYFEDLIGVSKPTVHTSLFIQIRINTSLWPYIESKP